MKHWDFLGGPGVKTLHSHCRARRVDLWLWNSDPMSGGVDKKINKMMQNLCEQGSTLINFLYHCLYFWHMYIVYYLIKALLLMTLCENKQKPSHFHWVLFLLHASVHTHGKFLSLPSQISAFFP